MNLDSEDLVHQFAQDWPEQFERSRLFLLVTKLTDENRRLTAENDRLNALVGQQDAPLSQTSVMPAAGFASVARPYVMPVDDEGARHGG